jgi:hypothetical protein
MLAAVVEEGKGGHFFVPVWLALWPLYFGSRLQLRLPIPYTAGLLGLNKRDSLRTVVKSLSVMLEFLGGAASLKTMRDSSDEGRFQFDE